MSEPVLCDKCELPIEGDHFTPILARAVPIMLHLHWGCGVKLKDALVDANLDVALYGTTDGSRIPSWAWEMLERAVSRADELADRGIVENLDTWRHMVDSAEVRRSLFPDA